MIRARKGRCDLARREVLAGGAALLAAGGLRAATADSVPIIDTHIHLFDPNRPQGAPYRGPKTAPSYVEGAFPDRYRALTEKYHVVGAIEVEASPWIEDNLWVLETAGKSDIMIGTIGNMQPDAPDFGSMIERYAKNPLFLGIRYGNLWKYDLSSRGGTPAFLAGAKLLADADLVMDTANPRLDLLQAVVRLNDAVPHLRIVIDHLPHFDPRPEERAAYHVVLNELARRPKIFAKLSEIIHPVNGYTSSVLSSYRENLDMVYKTFGEDRVLFGSDWPNILQDASLDDDFAISRRYFGSMPKRQQEKFFWANSLTAYKWKPRTAVQMALIGKR